MHRFLSLAVVFAAITSASVIITSSPAGACSCAQVDDAAAFEDADAVFVGQVIRTHPARDGEPVDVVILQVSDVYKGDVDRLQGVATSADSDCGYRLDGDGIYLVFATGDDLVDLEDGFYETSRCSGTRLLVDDDLGFEAVVYAPNEAGPPSTADIRAQLGDPRSSLFPEVVIFGGVLAFILGLAAWFSRKNRPAI